MKPRPNTTPSILFPRVSGTFPRLQNHRSVIRPVSSSIAPYSTLKARHCNNSRTCHVISITEKNPFRISARYASSRMVPSKSPFSNVPIPQVVAKLNPPEDTYAPELSIPSKAPGQGTIPYLFRCGKLYIGFYKKGIANVRNTSKLAKVLRRKSSSQKTRDEKDLGVLTRAEWQVVRRSRKDMLRLPPFAILVLIFGEWMPLLARWVTPLIPEPCRIPGQVERILRKSQSRREERLRRLAHDAARLVSRDRKPGSTATAATAVRPASVRPDDVDKLDHYTLLSLSACLDAHGWLWDRLFVVPPKPWLKWAVKRKLEYLRKDDALIRRDGGVQALGEKEVRRACFERGIAVLDVKEVLLRRALADWFRT